MNDRLDCVPDEDVRAVLRAFAEFVGPVDLYTVIDRMQGHRSGARIDGRTREGKAFRDRRLALMIAVFAAFERGYLVACEPLAAPTTVGPAGRSFLDGEAR